MADAIRGTTITLSIKFYEYINGPLIDPDPGTLSLEISKDDVPILEEPLTVDTGIERISTGNYAYEYAVPSDAELGDYIGLWHAELNGNPMAGEDYFSVFATPTDPTNSRILGEDRIINFVGELSPVYIDPDEILPLFPEAEHSEVLEAIFYASMEVEKWLPASGEIPHLVYEYIKASVACTLDQVHGLGIGSSNMQSFTLGDLTIQNSQSNSSRGALNRGNATSWCELAAALRKELSQKLAPMKGVVRGARLSNPIPRRHLGADNTRVYPQGTLDDVHRPPNRF